MDPSVHQIFLHWAFLNRYIMDRFLRDSNKRQPQYPVETLPQHDIADRHPLRFSSVLFLEPEAGQIAGLPVLG